MTPTVTDFTLLNEMSPVSALEKEFENFLNFYEDATSIYFALPTNEFVIAPQANLDGDFDPTSR